MKYFKLFQTLKQFGKTLVIVGKLFKQRHFEIFQVISWTESVRKKLRFFKKANLAIKLRNVSYRFPKNWFFQAWKLLFLVESFLTEMHI